MGAAMQTSRNVRPDERPLRCGVLGCGRNHRFRLFRCGRCSTRLVTRPVFGVRNQPPSFRSNKPLTDAHAWKGTSRKDRATAPRTPW